MRSKCIFPNLSAEMARKKVTQLDLSKQMHIDKATLSSKLTGKTEFTRSEMFFIADFFGEGVEKLFRI